jgi:flagellin
MSSLLTNTAAMTALQTLRNVNSSLETTQNRISTGQRVATASDNSAYWSIATTMRSDNAALSAVSDALGLGAATVDTMYTALTATVGDDKTGLTALKAKLVAAKEPGIDRAKIQAEVTSIQDDLKNTAELAVFNGENWLDVDSQAAGYNATKSVVSSFSRSGGVVKISTIDVGIDAVKLYDKTTNAGAVTTGMIDGGATFTPTAGNLVVSYTPAGGAATPVNIAMTTTTTIQQVADAINALKIGGLTVAVDGNKIQMANRSTTAVTVTGSNGFTGTATMAATTAANMSDKGVMDKEYDYYDGTAGAWKTATVDNIDISKLTDSAADLGILDSYIKAVDSALGEVTQASASLGATKTRISSNSNFVKSLMDAIGRGVGQLVDADMNAESTRLQAQQVQQQLGIQALSIANSNSQSILSLFK